MLFSRRLRPALRPGGRDIGAYVHATEREFFLVNHIVPQQIQRRCPAFSLVLWHPINDQQIWADAVTRLNVGSGRAFSASNLGSLVADLRYILDPQCITRAREVAAQMTKPAVSVARAADLLEHAVRLERVDA